MAETIKVLVSEEEVDARIEALGKQISEDYLCAERWRIFYV